ncbi:nitroreductase family protein [Desulfopila aestuarii]|uniref:FMN reductase (NADPH) n=1 Tax=Desulfopila aestuarii DSM 18488 TaxID=1121416 RepID=A0A1M7XZ85_9BACT|nr:nitroreductase family protein [Desulfopila aestuarii]SHO44477.1 FMN reductase (NADPH) [Desulfopila aestuarii DSM 18488]
MNSTIETILKRRSLRVFADESITEKEKALIIRCAMRAPTAGNMMLYSILEVADQKKKERLAVTCDDQPFIAKAPLVLIFLADMQRWYDYYDHSRVEEFCGENGLEYPRPAEADLLLASCDALIAAQNAVIAAESLGIGSCYIGDIMENYEIHRDMFDLPSLVFPVTMLCFGHYRQVPDAPSVIPRFAEKAIHFTDRYQRFSNEELGEIFENRYAIQFAAEKYLQNATNIGQHFYLKKTGSDFFKEMRRSVGVAVANWCGRSGE